MTDLLSLVHCHYQVGGITGILKITVSCHTPFKHNTMQLTCPLVGLCFILIIPATTSGPVSTGISIVIGMAKLFVNMWLVDEISNNDFPLKYVDEVRFYPGIRFYEDLTSWQRFSQDKNYHMNHVSYIHRFSVYCRSYSGKYHDAFTKFSNHFRGENK